MKIIDAYNEMLAELEDVQKQLRLSAEKIHSLLATFSDVMASCENDNFLEDFYKNTLEWVNDVEKEVLKELVEPSSGDKE